MAKQVVLTKVAAADLEQIIDYLIENWGIRVCEKFLDRFETVCKIISSNPDIYPIINRATGIRKCVLSRQNTIYYRPKYDLVEIITIFDSRQNPDKLTALIE